MLDHVLGVGVAFHVRCIRDCVNCCHMYVIGCHVMHLGTAVTDLVALSYVAWLPVIISAILLLLSPSGQYVSD